MSIDFILSLDPRVILVGVLAILILLSAIHRMFQAAFILVVMLTLFCGCWYVGIFESFMPEFPDSIADIVISSGEAYIEDVADSAADKLFEFIPEL